MRRLLIVLALLFAAGPALADDTALNTLFADYTSYAMGQDPITAGRAGDKKALARMPDVSPGADVLRKSFLEEFKEHLGAIDAGSLSPEGKQRRDSLDRALTQRLKFQPCAKLVSATRSTTLGAAGSCRRTLLQR